jgi:hypothetical protein
MKLMHLLAIVIAAAAALAQTTVMAAESTNRATGQVAAQQHGPTM